MKPKIATKKTNFIFQSLFIKSIQLLKSNPSKTGLMILFDILFAVSAYSIFKLSSFYAESIVAGKSLAMIIVLLTLSLLYFLLIILAYAFFKYCVLDSIKSLFAKTDFSFKRFWEFYSLNIALVGIFAAVMLVFSVLLGSIKQDYAPFIFLVLAIPYSIFLYIVVNASHSLFCEGATLKNSIRLGFRVTFTAIKIYKETILPIILIGIFLLMLLFSSGYLIRLISSKNYNLYLNAYQYFTFASKIVFDLILYSIILINRVSFYTIARESKFTK